MRKIERNMVEALKTRQDFKCDNTKVTFDEGGSLAEVYLWDNHIASLDFPIGRIFFQDCNYQTATTKSRLNAILHTFASDTHDICGISQQKGVWWLTRRDHTKYKRMERQTVYTTYMQKEYEHKNLS